MHDGVLPRAALWARFFEAAGALGANVLQVRGEELVARLQSATAAPPVATPSAHAVHPHLAVGGVALLDATAAAPAPTVVACGEFAVAETGSVALVAARAERAACLLAEQLWLLVPANEIVPTLDDALARIAARARAGTPYATLVSGPSRTADIERTLTIGVHGPRALTVVVVGA